MIGQVKEILVPELSDIFKKKQLFWIINLHNGSKLLLTMQVNAGLSTLVFPVKGFYIYGDSCDKCVFIHFFFKTNLFSCFNFVERWQTDKLNAKWAEKVIFYEKGTCLSN